MTRPADFPPLLRTGLHPENLPVRCAKPGQASWAQLWPTLRGHPHPRAPRKRAEAGPGSASRLYLSVCLILLPPTGVDAQDAPKQTSCRLSTPESASDTAALLSMSQVRNPCDFNTFRWRNRSEEARILVSRGADNWVTSWCTYFVRGWRTYCISC